MSLTVGVVAVQGDVSEHVRAIERAGEHYGHEVSVRTIRDAGNVPECDALAMPGGESTTISRLIAETGIDEEIVAHVAAGKPLIATCAGLIVASSDARDSRVETLGVLDVTVERNAFGRQAESFEAALTVEGMTDPFPAVFIRAPTIVDAGEVTVLATVDGDPVAVRHGPVVGTAFHPELTADPRFHRLALFETVPSTVDDGETVAASE
jgi:5'-phosphate synthase pdxT subunit